MFAGQPVVCVDDDVPDCPRLVVDKEILDVANLPVPRLDVIAGHGARTLEVRIALLHGPVPFGLNARQQFAWWHWGGGREATREYHHVLLAAESWQGDRQGFLLHLARRCRPLLLVRRSGGEVEWTLSANDSRPSRRDDSRPPSGNDPRPSLRGDSRPPSGA